MKYYTIFLGDELWTDCIDDMNSMEDFATGGMLWTDEELATACMNNLRSYDFEQKGEKFKIVELQII